MENAAPLESLMLHAGWLRRFAVALVRDEDVAEDVVQNTLLAAWQRPPAEAIKPRAWLATVSRNQAHDLHRSEKSRKAREDAATSALEASAPDPEALTGSLQIHRALAEEVTALPDLYRQVLVLRYYEGLDAPEIGVRLGIAAGTVRWRLKEGLDRVRQRLDARFGRDRAAWVAALAPLLPRSLLPAASGALGVAGGSATAAVGRLGKTAGSPFGLGFIAALVGIAALSAGLIFWLGPRVAERAERERGATASKPPRPSSAPEPRSPLPPPRFAPATTPAAAAAPAGERTAPEAPATPPENPETLVRHMLTATANDSYDDFVLYGSDTLKAALGKDDFQAAVKAFGAAFRKGYRLEPLGQLWQRGQVVHLWKLVLPDRDDHLLRMSILDGRVSGILIQ